MTEGSRECGCAITYDDRKPPEYGQPEYELDSSACCVQSLRTQLREQEEATAFWKAETISQTTEIKQLCTQLEQSNAEHEEYASNRRIQLDRQANELEEKEREIARIMKLAELHMFDGDFSRFKQALTPPERKEQG